MPVDHDHPHRPSPGGTRSLLFAVALVGGFAVVEAVGGWLSGSLALLADAGHMVSDAMALGLAAFAAWLAQRPVTRRHTYGFGRAEVVAAVVNAFFLLLIVAAVAWAAVGRFRNPVPIDGAMVLVIASIGLLVNVIVAWTLIRSEQTLNIRAAFLHVIGDLLGSVAAITSGAVVLLTGWTPIDPILSLFICLLIVVACIRLLREALQIVMEAVPRGIDIDAVHSAMAGVLGVRRVHDLHIWQIASGNVMLTAHIVVTDLAEWDRIHAETRAAVAHQAGITHLTLQPEPES